MSIRAILAVAIWGSSFVATRVALEAFPPTTLVAVRLSLAAIALAVIQCTRRPPDRMSRFDARLSLMLGVVLFSHLSLQSVGLRYTTAIRTGWIIGFVPATTAFAVHVLGYERIRAAGWMGMAIASFGVLVVSGAAPSDLRHARFGDLLQLSSCLTWTAYTILGMGLVGRIGALRATTTPFAVGAALAWVATALSDSTVGAVTPRTITAVVILGLVCNAAAFVLWFQAVQSHGAARVGSTPYFEPFFTLAAAVAVLGEPVGAITTLGGVGVFAGVWLVGQGAVRSPGTRRTRRRSQQPVGPGRASDAAW